MKKPVAPCKGCEEHNATCKFGCDRWKKFERANAEYREAYHQHEAVENAISRLAISRAHLKYKYKKRR